MNDKSYFLAGQNKNKLLAFGFTENRYKNVLFQLNERYAMIYLKNGNRRKTEIYYGHTFNSQSGNFIPINNQITKIEFFGKQGKLIRTWKNE